MPYIIGTAGHIDHGKTSLIKTLTGQDTDRLKEEKERGISIDLGFAYLDLPDGTRAGVVDVPGHERFIRNMLAGAHGIDLVLFTVAADDGVMPQTEEHLDILHLLGVQRAIFVMTKCDLVSDARVREVEEEIRILTAGSTLENSPTIPFSSITEQGLPELRHRIAETLQRGDKPQPQSCFRLPVDRVFLLQGHGLIVTGTALAGEVKVGDRVRCLPGRQLLRVRSLQVHNQPVEIGGWGQRLALNLSGTERPAIERGHVICHESFTLTSDRIDASLEGCSTHSGGIRNHQRVRVHLGTAERLAKLIVLGSQQEIGPKEHAYCQLVLTEPLLALRGDRFVIRDETARRTLGGGVVIHPWARQHERADPTLLETLRMLDGGEFATVVETFLNESGDFAVPIGLLSQFVNMPDHDVRRRVAAVEAVRVFSFDGEYLYGTEKKWHHTRERLLTALRDFHEAHPLAPGMDMEELRSRMPYQMGSKVFRAFMEQLEAGHAVARDANILRLPGHQIRLRDEQTVVVERIKSLLGATPLAPPDLKQIEGDIGIGRAELNDMVRVMEREKSIVRVTADLYFLEDCIRNLKVALCDYLSTKSDITPAAFRDFFGTSRKYAIPLLEYFDREGVTVRVGDVRRKR